MAISSESKAKLDDRLACGEITIEEYNSIITATSQKPEEAVSHKISPKSNEKLFLISHVVFAVALIWYSLDMGHVSFKSIFGLLFFKIAAYINIVIYILPSIIAAIVTSKVMPNASAVVKISVAWVSVALSVIIVGISNDFISDFSLNC